MARRPMSKSAASDVMAMTTRTTNQKCADPCSGFGGFVTISAARAALTPATPMNQAATFPPQSTEPGCLIRFSSFY